MPEKDFLTDSEIAKFLLATKKTSYPLRDHALMLLAYRHGLRVSELISLRTSDVSLEDSQIHIKRSKKGLTASHPMEADELRSIKAYLKERDSRSPYLFLSERKSPFTRFAINYLVQTIGKLAKLSFHVHPHMLRHSCGYFLANKGFDTRLIQDYLGHRDITSTVRYTKTNPARFKNMWR